MREQPLPPPLTAGRVRALAAAPHLDAAALQWLIWLPFMNAHEVGRCLECPPWATYRLLRALRAAELIEAVSLAEPDQKREQRYCVTDEGLYVYALRFDPPLDVARLARDHPVREAQLLARLARPGALIRLADLASRVVADGRAQKPSAFQLVRWSQPWQHYYTGRTGRRKRLCADALFEVASAEGHSQQFCLLLDLGEHRQPSFRRERALLRSLLEARDAQFWQGGDIPFPLLVTEPHRLASWGRQLVAVCESRGVSVPRGALTTFDRLEQGCFAPIWWTLREVAAFSAGGGGESEQLVPADIPPHALAQFCDRMPAPPAPPPQTTAEVPAQAAAPRPGRNLRQYPEERLLKRYARGGFSAAARRLRPADLLAPRATSHAELTRLTALLNLRLSDVEKALLTWLAQHTLLSLSDLRGMVAGGQLTLTPLHRGAAHLLGLNLLSVRYWDEGANIYEQQRYHPSELALRVTALREGLPPTHYLTRDPASRDRPTDDECPSPWVQRGLKGLWGQIRHTAGVYACMVQVIRATRERGTTEILAWKSAREAVRPFVHPESGVGIQLRPDGEVLYREPAGCGPLRTILLEYDRGTMERKDYQMKFETYQAYWQAQGYPPLLVLFVARLEQRIGVISESLQKVGGHLPVQILSEADLLSVGLVMRDGRIDLRRPARPSDEMKYVK
jgi:hypothetical protein